MILELLPQSFAICRLSTREQVPQWAMNSPFFSISRSADELSIVCSEEDVPPDVKAVHA